MQKPERAVQGTIHTAITSIFAFATPVGKLVDQQWRRNMGSDSPTLEEVQEWSKDPENVAKVYLDTVRLHPEAVAELVEACCLLIAAPVTAKKFEEDEE